VLFPPRTVEDESDRRFSERKAFRESRVFRPVQVWTRDSVPSLERTETPFFGPVVRHPPPPFRSPRSHRQRYDRGISLACQELSDPSSSVERFPGSVRWRHFPFCCLALFELDRTRPDGRWLPASCHLSDTHTGVKLEVNVSQPAEIAYYAILLF